MTMLTRTKQRAALHYFIATVVFAIYGGQVCPFIESISIWQSSAYSLVTFSLLFMARTLLIQEGGAFKNAQREVGLFLFGAVALASWYFSVYDFPIESGLKVLFGIGSLGALISLDLALQAQIKHYPLTEYTKLPESMSHMGHSIATQLAILVIFIVLMLTTTLTMVMIKDIHWLSESFGRVDEHMAKISIIKEFVFVALILITYT